ncbi:hypothetical protein ABTM39_20455, partial [Acinetobacter baumannii]
LLLGGLKAGGDFRMQRDDIIERLVVAAARFQEPTQSVRQDDDQECRDRGNDRRYHPSPSLELRIEGIAQTVAHDVDGDDG